MKIFGQKRKGEPGPPPLDPPLKLPNDDISYINIENMKFSLSNAYLKI
jgi:hypothetical protein